MAAMSTRPVLPFVLAICQLSCCICEGIYQDVELTNQHVTGLNLDPARLLLLPPPQHYKPVSRV